MLSSNQQKPSTGLFSLLMYFSCSWRTMQIAYIMLFHAINPNCMSSIIMFEKTRIKAQSFLPYLQWLFPKLSYHVPSTLNYAPAWTPSQPFTLVHIHQPTLTPVLLYPNLLHHSITHICHPLHFNLASSLNHICHNTRWSHWFAWLDPTDCSTEFWSFHQAHIPGSLPCPKESTL